MIDAHGMPRTWRHFQYGLRVMGVLDARESLRSAGVAQLPMMEKQDRVTWIRSQEREAGW